MRRYPTSASRNEGHHIIGLVPRVQTAIGAKALISETIFRGDLQKYIMLMISRNRTGILP
jgi:hypothetical protein